MVCGRGLHPLACHSRSSEFTTPSHTLNGKFDLPNSRSLYDFFPSLSVSHRTIHFDRYLYGFFFCSFSIVGMAK